MKHLPRFLFSAAAVLAVSALGAHPFDGPREALAARLKTDATLKQVLLQNARPVTADFDYTRLLDKDTDVLLLGEQHGDPAAKREVNVILKSLAAHNGGCTHLASEFFLSEEQPALDAFSSKQITLEQLEKQLALPGYSSAAAVAVRYGLRPLGLDSSKALENPARAITPQGMRERSRRWGEIIAQIARQDLTSRFILYAGAWHTQLAADSYPTMPAVLAEHGLKTKTAEFANTGERHWRTLLEEGGLAERPVLIAVPPPYVKTVNADFIIYLPAAKPLAGETREQAEKMMGEKSFNWKHCTEDPDHPLCKIQLEFNRSK